MKANKNTFIHQLFSHYGWIPLFAIIVDGLHKIYFLSQLRLATIDVEHITSIWVGLQVIFSTFFGLVSDKYCRKTILSIALGISIITMPLLKMHWFWTSILLNGVLGNIAPIARAAYCDVQINHDKEPNIINTFLVLPIPWMLLSFNTKIFNSFSFITTYSIGIVVFLCCLIFFKDLRDKDKKDVSKESFKKLKEKFWNWDYGRVALAFLVLNSGWWILTYNAEGHLSLTMLLKYFFLIIGLSFFIGAVVARAYNFKPRTTLPLVFLFISLLMTFDYIFSLFLGSPLNPSTFMHFTLIGGAGLPLVYVFFGLKASIHEQGTVYGVLESIRSLTEFIGPTFLSLVSVSNSYLVLIPASLISYLMLINLGKSQKRIS